MPETSVILPFHRVDNFFFEAVRSILSSSYEDFELILVADGAAKLLVAELKDSFTDKKVRIFENSESGLVSALNTGAKVATGEFIARMDSDDVCLPNRLGLQAKLLRSCPAVAVVGGQVTYVCEHGSRLGESRYVSKISRKLGMKPILPMVAHPTTMFRRLDLQAVGGYRDNFKHVEDQDLWNRMLELGSFRNLESSCLLYRVHSGQVSSNHKLAQQQECLKANYFDITGAELSTEEFNLTSVTIAEDYFQMLKRFTSGFQGLRLLGLYRLFGYFAVRNAASEFRAILQKDQQLDLATRRLVRLTLDLKVLLFFLPFSLTYLVQVMRESFSRPTLDWRNCDECLGGLVHD